MNKETGIICLPYKPHKAQLEVHNDKHRYKTLVCGRRFGKTTLAINELIKESLNNPDNYWYVAPTYRQVKLIAWELLKKYAVDKIRAKPPNETEMSLKFVSGGEIRLIGADNPEALRGVGLKGCIFDEYAQTRPEVWQSIVRPMLTEKKGWAWFIGTPKGKLNILYEQYIRDIDKQDKNYINLKGEGIEIDSDYKSFKFVTLDNPYIDSIEIDKARKELAPQYFRQEFEASFEEYVGKIYQEYEERHNINIPALKGYWAYYVGIDTGRNTAICFIAIDEKDKAYQFDEINDYDGIVKDIVIKIKDKCTKYNIKPNYIIDSASQVKREYESNGIYPMDSEKDIQNCIEVVRNRFKSDRFFIDKEKCRISIMQHSSYVWDDKLQGIHKRPMPLKENDHQVNAVQYVLGYSSLNRSGKNPEQKLYEKSLKYFTVRRDRVSLNNLG